MAEIARTGIRQVVSSWWGRGSVEDKRLASVISVARRAGLTVAVHVEPYGGRSSASIASDLRYLAGLGIRDIYVYRAASIPASSWARMARPAGIRLFAHTWDVAFAASGRFQGTYTYSFDPNDPGQFVSLCGAAHARGLLCAPSVGPGYDAQKATGDMEIVDRANGETYDMAWGAALAGNPDLVTITSYNEWIEGTQIEPAAARPGWPSYEGAWGTTGSAAESAYLTRTAGWISRLS